MKKVAFIIPGLFQTTKTKGYKQISSFFKSKNIKPILVDIDWKYKTLTDYIYQFKKIYEKNKANEIYLFGFSFGTLIAFSSANDIKSKALILCSLSPGFKEDLAYWKKSWKNIMGKNRWEDFKKYSFNEISRKIKTKTYILVGEKEAKQMLKRSNDANNKLKNSELIMVRGAKHDISRREYMDAVREVIYNLN